MFLKGFASPPETLACNPGLQAGIGSHRPEGRGLKPKEDFR
jgi:hypothetical protein